MRMKRVYHPETNRYGFFIGRADGYILVIPYGTAHIYEYGRTLEREIARIASQLEKEEIPVYVDLSPVIGKGVVLKFKYDKKHKSFEWFPSEELSLKELPEVLKKQLKRFYERKKNVILESMFPSEVRKFTALLSKM